MVTKNVMIAVAALMTTLLALLMMSHRHGSDPFDRYKAFTAAHSTLKANFVSTINGKDYPGFLLMQKPNHLLYVCHNGDSTYSASSTEQGYVEIDTGSELYDENPVPNHLAVYESRISPATQMVPSLVFVPDLKTAIPPKPTITADGTSDKIYATAKGPMGSAEYWVTINEAGEVTDLHVKSNVQGRVSDIAWKLTYEFPHPTLKDFVTPLPLGYEPYALSRSIQPIEIGKTLPVDGWAQAGSSNLNLLKLAGHKTFLLAILDDSAPSQRSLNSLSSLSAKIPVLKIAKGSLSDPSDKLLSKINPPGAPTFILADASGKVLKLWYGYDSDQKSAFESDVLDSSHGVQPAK